MKITDYVLKASINRNLTVAVAADLHDRKFNNIADSLYKRKPDIITLPGDTVSGRIDNSKNALDFLRVCVEIAPTFYSIGNHEGSFEIEDIIEVEKTGAVVLDDCYTQKFGINIGGLSTGYRHIEKQTSFQKTPVPNLKWLEEFSRLQGFKLLLCHHPEYFDNYIKPLNIDLTVSGHAHGGQIRIFKQGIFAPGQGFFPKYTGGFYENRMVLSRGLTNTAKFIPRFGNEPELIYISIEKGYSE